MKPISLTMERFGSFVERITFEFPAPGLYFMQGKNLEEPRLEANGTGKTTIWKALTWCLYGKDPRGLKAGDVANWEEPKGASVSFGYEDEGVQCEVKRSHSPNAWLLSIDGEDWIDLTKDESNQVMADLRLEFSPWLNCVLMAQGQPMFLDLAASAKATLFSDVMGLDRWVDYADKAGKLASATDATIRALERAKAESEGELRGIDSESIHEALTAWETGRGKRLAALTEAYERDMLRNEGMTASLKLLRLKLAEVERLQALYAGKAKRCPKCDQLIRDEELEQALAKFEEARHLVRDLESDLARLERSLDQMEDRADEIKAETNPYRDQLESRQRQADALRDQLRAHDVGLVTATERHSMLGFWVRGFKDLRLQLIADALEELEIEVNSCVMALGLLDWELLFEVDRETKGGSIARGFSVYVKSPHNDRQVPWESWSGGEAQRLRLAAQMGLSNLIRNQTGASIALEVWDEPTNGVSPRGVIDLMESLSQRARDEQRTIFVVDHRSLGFAGFDGTVTVLKDKQGSYVEWD